MGDFEFSKMPNVLKLLNPCKGLTKLNMLLGNMYAATHWDTNSKS